MAGGTEASDPGGDVLDSLGASDRRAAILLDDERHGGKY
jgi:hypothetical protein